MKYAVILEVLKYFKKPWAKVAALAIMCATVVILSGCTLTANGIKFGDKELEHIEIIVEETADAQLTI